MLTLCAISNAQKREAAAKAEAKAEYEQLLEKQRADWQAAADEACSEAEAAAAAALKAALERAVRNSSADLAWLALLQTDFCAASTQAAAEANADALKRDGASHAQVRARSRLRFIWQAFRRAKPVSLAGRKAARGGAGGCAP